MAATPSLAATVPNPVLPLPIVILISGRGSNMRVIAERAARGELPVVVRAVISDRADAGGLALARALQIRVAVLSPQDFADRSAYDTVLATLVATFQPRLVVLAGFMRILSPHFIAPFAGRMLNVHPSLLPLYRGLHTHRRALENGDAVHGVSVHFVTEELDGGPVIMQASVAVRSEDTEASLSARVQRQEHTILPQAIEWFARGRLELRGQQAWLDGSVLNEPVMMSADE